MQIAKKIGLILLNILTAGAGFAYLGYPLITIIVQVSALSLILLMSYLAIFSPLIMIFAMLLNLLYIVFTVFFTLKLFNKSLNRNTKWLFIFLLSSFLLLPLVNLVRPSMSYTMPHNHWEPHIFEGESFLVEFKPKQYLLNDFVIIKKLSGTIVVRQIQKIENDKVELALPAENKSVETVKIEDLAGKVHYVWYPKKFDRFLKHIN